MSSRPRAGRGARHGRAGSRESGPAVNWALGITQLVMMLIFVAYFVCVQVNAVAYLAGTRHAIIGGTTPPLPLNSTGAAVADFAVGLVIEAIGAIDLVIAALFAVAGIREARDRHRPPAPARTPSAPQHGSLPDAGDPRGGSRETSTGAEVWRQQNLGGSEN